MYHPNNWPVLSVKIYVPPKQLASAELHWYERALFPGKAELTDSCVPVCRDTSAWAVPPPAEAGKSTAPNCPQTQTFWAFPSVTQAVDVHQ